ncbi:MAG: hypothetical protein JW751_13985 [Polyangiaceae bacterium]|nr:hypothetical protein [Polyangiaceae bacterium]
MGLVATTLKAERDGDTEGTPAATGPDQAEGAQPSDLEPAAEEAAPVASDAAADGAKQSANENEVKAAASAPAAGTAAEGTPEVDTGSVAVMEADGPPRPESPPGPGAAKGISQTEVEGSATAVGVAPEAESAGSATAPEGVAMADREVESPEVASTAQSQTSNVDGGTAAAEATPEAERASSVAPAVEGAPKAESETGVTAAEETPKAEESAAAVLEGASRAEGEGGSEPVALSPAAHESTVADQDVGPASEGATRGVEGSAGVMAESQATETSSREPKLDVADAVASMPSDAPAAPEVGLAVSAPTVTASVPPETSAVDDIDLEALGRGSKRHRRNLAIGVGLLAILGVGVAVFQTGGLAPAGRPEPRERPPAVAPATPKQDEESVAADVAASEAAVTPPSEGASPSTDVPAGSSAESPSSATVTPPSEKPAPTPAPRARGTQRRRPRPRPAATTRAEPASPSGPRSSPIERSSPF